MVGWALIRGIDGAMMDTAALKAAIVQELQEAGLPISSIGEMPRIAWHKHQEAAAIALRWLEQIDDPWLKEWLVRSLTERTLAAAAVPVIIREFWARDTAEYDGMRWAIGNALEVFASPLLTNELIKIATATKYGSSRQMCVCGLAKADHEKVLPVLHALVGDDDVEGHAISALRKIGDPRSLEILRAASTHEKAWIRKAAKAGVAKILRSHPELAD